MRILVLAACPFPWRRGTPIRIHRLSEAPAARDHEVEVATYFIGDQSIDVSIPVRRTGRVWYYGKSSPGPSVTKLALLNPMLFWLARRMCRQQPFDIIYAHHIEALLVARWLRLSGISTPVVFDAHTRIGEELQVYGPALFNGAKRIVGNWLDSALPATADHIVTVSNELRDLFIRRSGKSEKEVTTIVNGVEREFIYGSRSAHQKESVRIDSNENGAGW